MTKIDHTKTKMLCCLYLRVSSEEQLSNFSISTQEEICRREALNKGFTVDRVFTEEGKSAKTITGRPALLELLEYCRINKKDLGAVIVYRIDRISRNTIDYLAIRKTLSDSGIVILSATEPTGSSPTEKMLETILASFGQLDNDIRGERARNGLRKRFLSGLPASSVPLGYAHLTVDNHRTIIQDTEIFPKIKRAWDLMSTGTKSLTEIATIMNEWGICVTWRKKKRPIDKQYAAKLFHNTFYMGVLQSRKYKERVLGTHIPMITEELFYKVQSVISGRSNQAMVNRHNRDSESFPLRGLTICSVCKRPYTGGFSKGRHKHYGYYFCPGGCKGSVIAISKLHEQLVSHLRTITPSKETLQWFTLKLHASYKARLTLLESRHKVAQASITALKERYNSLIEKNLSGLYSDEIYKSQAKKIEEEIAVAHLIKSENHIDKYNIEEVICFTNAMLSDLGKAFTFSNLTQKRELLGSIYQEKLVIENKTIRTATLSPLFALIHDINRGYVPSSADERT